MVRILSGMAMPANATTGTQTRLRIATATPINSAPSQLSQPSAYWRFCSRVSPRARGSRCRQCFLRIWKPP